MATITESVVIARPIHEVFAFIADARNDPLWCPNVRESEQTQGEGPAVGARYREVHKPGPKAAELDIEMLEHDPPRRAAWRASDESGTFVVSYDLEPVAGDATRVTQTDETLFQGLTRLLAPVIHFSVRRTLPKQFATLKSHLEEQSAGR